MLFQQLGPFFYAFRIWFKMSKGQSRDEDQLTSCPPHILSPSCCLEVCQAPNSNHSQPASLYPEGVAWAKSSSVLPQLITALHHHLCPSLSSLCLCSYPVSSLHSSAGSLPAVFMEPSGLRTMEQDDPAKNICDETRRCQTVKERQEEWETFALHFLEKYATR